MSTEDKNVPQGAPLPHDQPAGDGNDAERIEQRPVSFPHAHVVTMPRLVSDYMRIEPEVTLMHDPCRMLNYLKTK